MLPPGLWQRAARSKAKPDRHVRETRAMPYSHTAWLAGGRFKPSRSSRSSRNLKAGQVSLLFALAPSASARTEECRIGGAAGEYQVHTSAVLSSQRGTKAIAEGAATSRAVDVSLENHTISREVAQPGPRRVGDAPAGRGPSALRACGRV